MVTITDKAAAKAVSILAAEGKADWGLRIYNAGGGCCGPSYGLDIDEKPLADDDVVEKAGLKVFVDKTTMEALKGMQLDYLEDGEREGFVINGGADPSCGSGGGAAPSCGSGCKSCG